MFSTARYGLFIRIFRPACYNELFLAKKGFTFTKVKSNNLLTTSSALCWKLFSKIDDMPPKRKGTTKTSSAKKEATDAKSKKIKEQPVEDIQSDENGSEENGEATVKPVETEKKKARGKTQKEKSPEVMDSNEDSNENDEKVTKKPKDKKEKKSRKESVKEKTNIAKKSNERGESSEVSNSESDKSVGKRNAKKKHVTDDEDSSDEPEKKKVKSDMKQPLNKTDSELDDIQFGCDKVNEDGEKYNLKIACWNVSGIRALIKKNGMDYFNKEDADIVALQEIKCDKNKLPNEVKLPGYERYFLDSTKSGYCGVALYTKIKPIDVKYGIKNSECNDEGRIITAEFDKYYVVNVYVPNAGQKLKTMPKRLEWNKDFKNFIKELDAKKPVIICGDMNVAHQEIDLKNPKTNTKNAGFTKEERDGMTDFLEQGFVDTFRKLYPDKAGAYTFWSYFQNSRAKNIGWRLDYFIVSERIAKKVCDNVIRDKVYGSDHCPIVLFINL